MSDTLLPAKCPRCKGNGRIEMLEHCQMCKGKGTIEVTLPADDWYTRHCTNPLCGFDNGMCQGDRLDYSREHGGTECFMCKTGKWVWLPICESEVNPPWLEHQHSPFADYQRRMYETAGDECIEEGVLPPPDEPIATECVDIPPE